MDELTPIEPRTKELFEMDDQSFASNDTYPTDSDARSQSESIEQLTSGRWDTNNTSSTMESERHLSANSVSRDIRASSNSTLRYRDSDRQDVTNVSLAQSDGQSYEDDRDKLTSDRVHVSREDDETRASMPSQSARQNFGDDADERVLEGRSESSEKNQPGSMISIPSMDPSYMSPRARKGEDNPHGNSKSQEPAHPVPAVSVDEKHKTTHRNSSADEIRGSSERLESLHLRSTSEVERRGRSPSPRPKVSAETKARWAMLKQLAGVSQPHDVEDADVNRRLGEEKHTTEAEIRVGEAASVRDSSQTDESADDASIERYLQKLQGDPHIDNRGLQEGLSRMHSHNNSNHRQDQNSALGYHFKSDTHLRAHELCNNTQIREVENAMRKVGQGASDTLQTSEGRAEQAFGGHEAALRRDEHAVGASLEEAGRRAEAELRSASHGAQNQLQKDKQGFERDIRNDTKIADIGIHMLDGQAAKEFRRVEHGLEAGLQGAVNAAESYLPHVDSEHDLRRGENDLVEGFHKAKNTFSRTGLGPDIRKGEHDLIGEVRKLEHEFPRPRLEQEIRKEGARLVEDIRKVENDLAKTGFGQEVGKGEHHLMDKIQRLEHDLSDLGLGQDLRRGEQDLKQGLQEAAAHLRKDEQALGKGAEAAGQSAKDGLEHVGRLAVKGTAIAGKLGMMALDHAGSGNNVFRAKTDVGQPGHDMVTHISQQTPSKPHQPTTDLPRPTEAPDLQSASKDRRSSPLPAKDTKRPPIAEPPRHPQAPQGSQPGHSHGPSDNKQPHFSPIPPPARNPFSSPATNKSPLGRMPSPSPGNNQRSQAPVRKPVLPPRTQGSSNQKPPTAMPPHSQPQRPQGAPQHPPQPQHPQDAQSHPSHTLSSDPRPPHPQGAPQHPPQPQHSQDAQSHPSHTLSSHPQPSHTQQVPQRPQNILSQHPPPQHAMKSAQHAPNPILQHLQASPPEKGSQQNQLPNATPQHPQATHLKLGPQQSQSPKTTPQQPQDPQSHGSPQQRHPASVKPQQPQWHQTPHRPEVLQPGQLPNTKTQQPQAPNPQGALEQKPQTRMPPGTRPPHTQPPPQQGSQDPMSPNPQVSLSRTTPQQRPANTTQRPQPQHLQGTRQPTPLKARSGREAQQLEAVSNSNAQQAKVAISGATAGLHPARIQPLSGSTNYEGKTDGKEPRASVMREGRKVAVESQHQEAQYQERQSANDGRCGDDVTECSPHQTQYRSTMESAAESPVVSGPQSMLNMFKFRADAAVEASGESPSFTDRRSRPALMMLCSMGYLANIATFG